MRSLYLVIGYFANIIITDITAGQEIDTSQKLGLTDKTCYMAFH